MLALLMSRKWPDISKLEQSWLKDSTRRAFCPNGFPFPNPKLNIIHRFLDTLPLPPPRFNGCERVGGILQLKVATYFLLWKCLR